MPSPEIVQRARGLETPVNSNRSGAVAGSSGARGESEARGRNKAATRRLKKSRGVGAEVALRQQMFKKWPGYTESQVGLRH